MKERPILFSAPMVRALLDGTKTQTRRVCKPLLSDREWVEERENGSFWRCADGEPTCYTGVWETHEYAQQFPVRCPYGPSGDRLWVREAWTVNLTGDPKRGGSGTVPIYRAEHPHAADRWRPSIFMPRWASRITLEVTGVRVERLQDISEADAIAEGVRELPLQAAEPRCWWTADASAGAALHARTAINAYRLLWEYINGPGSWDANPWVWAVEFRRVQP
jgi:hypothetical protein